MLRRPLTSRTSFLLYGFMAAEILGRFGVVEWAVLISSLALLELVWDRPKWDLTEEQDKNKGRS